MSGKRKKNNQTPVAVVVPNVEGDYVTEAQPNQETGPRKKTNETIVPSDTMDMLCCMAILSSAGDSGGECCMFMLACALVAAAVQSTQIMTSAVYRTAKRSDNTEADDAITLLNTLKEGTSQQQDDLYAFVDALRNNHHTGFFFSTRTSKDFDRRKEWCGNNDAKEKRANPTNLINYMSKEAVVGKYTNNGRTLFNRTVFHARSEISVQQIRGMDESQKQLLIADITSKYKVGLTSSQRTKTLVEQLCASKDTTAKIDDIIDFLRHTEKKQTMYKVIVAACKEISPPKGTGIATESTHLLGTSNGNK